MIPLMARLTAEQKRLAGAAVAARRGSFGWTQQELTDEAHLSAVDRINALENGREWPRARNQHAVEVALKWKPGALERIAQGSDPADEDMRPLGSPERPIELQPHNTVIGVTSSEIELSTHARGTATPGPLQSVSNDELLAEIARRLNGASIDQAVASAGLTQEQEDALAELARRGQAIEPSGESAQRQANVTKSA